jgi:hypothetical protein
MRQKCEEELDAEWKMLVAREETTPDSSLRQDDPPLQWAWRKLGSP